MKLRQLTKQLKKLTQIRVKQSSYKLHIRLFCKSPLTFILIRGEGVVSILRLLGFMLYGEIKKKSNRQSQYETSLICNL